MVTKRVPKATKRKHTKELFHGCNNRAAKARERFGTAIGNSHLSHAPGSQNPYTIGGLGVLDGKCHIK
jgi:hypothetical protein